MLAQVTHGPLSRQQMAKAIREGGSVLFGYNADGEPNVIDKLENLPTSVEITRHYEKVTRGIAEQACSNPYLTPEQRNEIRKQAEAEISTGRVSEEVSFKELDDEIAKLQSKRQQLSSEGEAKSASAPIRKTPEKQ